MGTVPHKGRSLDLAAAHCPPLHVRADLAEAGLGVALITRVSMSGLDTSRFRVLGLRERVGRTIGVVRALNRSASPSASAFRSFLIEKGKAMSGAAPRSRHRRTQS